MSLYRMELKRLCKTRMTVVLLAIALVLAVVMAYLPVTFIGWSGLDTNGNEVSYTGIKALRKRQEQQVSGTITPDVMQEALETYQRVYRQYDASSINDIPTEVFYKELARYQPFVNNAKEAFADPKTGMAPGVMGLTAEDMQHFYDQLPNRLGSVIWLEQEGKPGYAQAQAIAQKKFDAVKKPFFYSFGVSSDAMDYQTLLGLLLTLLCAVIAAPVFASDAQTGAQDIQLCTKNGGLRLAAAKLAAAFSITGAAYLLCGVVWILVTNTLFGWESTKTSVQWLFSGTSLLPYTVGQMEDGVGHAGGELPALLCGGGLCAGGIRLGKEQPDRALCGTAQCGGTAGRLHDRAGFLRRVAVHPAPGGRHRAFQCAAV